MTMRPEDEEMRRRYIEAAWRLGCSGGEGALSIRALARDVGRAAGSVYLYFEDKGSLMNELRRIGAAKLEATLAAASQSMSVETRLAALCQRYLAYMAECAWLYVDDVEGALLRPDALHAAAFIERAEHELRMTRHGAPEEHDARPRHLWLALQGLASAVAAAPEIYDRDFVGAHLRFVTRGVTVMEV
ncbi:MAG: TetR/AcrR family transcriptional regulator [Deltaproteobacteria bacterium]|nr:TetR/AcrR family transcriptional regulator [Nannocystaceae bacterium]